MIVNRLDNLKLSDDPIVLVAGAGAAGMSAAISAARAGANVVLVESNSQVGGTVVHALIHTLAGIYDEQCHPLNDGIANELVEKLSRESSDVKPRQIGRTWNLNVCPDTYAKVVEEWLATEPGVTVVTSTQINSVSVEEDRVCSVRLNSGSQLRELPVLEAIDTTGSASLVHQFDPGLVSQDSSSVAAGLILRYSGLPPGSLDFPKGTKILRGFRKAAADGTLPKNFANTWIDQGVAAGELYVKLFVPMPPQQNGSTTNSPEGPTMEELGSMVEEFLSTYPEFENASVDKLGELGIRDGGRVVGEYCLTVDDVRQGRQFDDGVCRCVWPIEFWHPEEGVQLEYLTQGPYQIPLRCLKVKDAANLWTAGKCLSADHLAQASARVVGSCWTMGEAAGQAAAAKTLMVESK